MDDVILELHELQNYNIDFQYLMIFDIVVL